MGLYDLLTGNEIVPADEAPPPPLRWFIVVGRAYGDDEASAVRYHATDAATAMEMFKEEMGHEPGSEDGPGTVWIDATFDCGFHQPFHQPTCNE